MKTALEVGTYGYIGSPIMVCMRGVGGKVHMQLPRYGVLVGGRVRREELEFQFEEVPVDPNWPVEYL